ncbi:uncharacterized protein [Lolium perenne]|uniref:uncharacterized protein isoform X2 n=1 Tax=Lolium perenne TaxID=4522 RepID=UPI003A99234F
MTSPPSPRLVRTPMQHTGPHLKLCLPCRLRRSSTARLRELTSPACFKPLRRRRGRRRPASRGAASPRLRFNSRVSRCLSARELRRPCLAGVFAWSPNTMDAAVSARWGASTTCRTSPHNHAAVHPGAPLATQRCPWQEWKPASVLTAEACSCKRFLLLRLHGFRVCGHVTELSLLLATTPTCSYWRWFRWRNCCWAGQSLLRLEPCSNHARMQMITCPGG